MFDNVPAVPLKLRSKSAPSGSSKPYALTRQQREASTYSQECSDLQLGRDGTMRRLLPGFHHCPALCKQVGLVRLRHRFSIHFPCTLHLLSPFVKSFFLPAKIRKRQGLNAEKSKILFLCIIHKSDSIPSIPAFWASSSNKILTHSNTVSSRSRLLKKTSGRGIMNFGNCCRFDAGTM